MEMVHDCMDYDLDPMDYTIDQKREIIFETARAAAPNENGDSGLSPYSHKGRGIVSSGEDEDKKIWEIIAQKSRPYDHDKLLGPAALEGLQGAKSVKCDSSSTPMNIESQSASK